MRLLGTLIGVPPRSLRQIHRKWKENDRTTREEARQWEWNKWHVPLCDSHLPRRWAGNPENLPQLQSYDGWCDFMELAFRRILIRTRVSHVFKGNGVNEISLTAYLNSRQEKLVCTIYLKVTHASHITRGMRLINILSSSTCNYERIIFMPIEISLNNIYICL